MPLGPLILAFAHLDQRGSLGISTSARQNGSAKHTQLTGTFDYSTPFWGAVCSYRPVQYFIEKNYSLRGFSQGFSRFSHCFSCFSQAFLRIILDKILFYTIW